MTSLATGRRCPGFAFASVVAGQYLLLGSASLDLLKQSGETLAGRIAYLELAPFNLRETGPDAIDQLWLRSGFPECLLATNDARSLRWRKDFIRTYLERDIPQFGPRSAAQTLRRFWVMLAHHQGNQLNTAQFARNLGVDGKTAAAYLDLLLIRRLPQWHANIGKRLVRSPKVYVRDTGLTHALLSTPDKETLLAHPVLGNSWDGFVVENCSTAHRMAFKASPIAPAAVPNSICYSPGRTTTFGQSKSSAA